MSVNDNGWDVTKAAATYNIAGWGDEYFNVNSKGFVIVKPDPSQPTEIELHSVMKEAMAMGLKTPLLLRFQDLLRHRVRTLNEAFGSAIQEAGYQGLYRGVFPIKVNQLREVVEEIVDAGVPYHYGIEAGSKPELFAALVMHKDPESLVICNGYKDAQFIQTALLGRKLGKKVIMVVEKLEELRHVIEVSKQIGVTPWIGIRVRLHTKSAGKWALSGGEDAKFGLNTADILEATQMLQEAGLEESFKLLHFHIGSQVPDIRTVKKSVREAARYFAKIYQHGFKLEYIDVGGGLGVDYDGSRTNCESSINYTLSEYARDIVYNIAEVLNEEKVPHPNIVSESGRAIVAHHSVLIVDVFGMIEKTKTPSNVTYPAPCHKLVQDLLDLRQTLNKKNRLEHFHDMQQIKEDSETRFELGLLDLKTQAQIETLYWELAESLLEQYEGMKSIPQEILQLKNSLGDQYICNFSVFQSMLDHWALGQLFPIMPIHRLEEKPDYNGFLVDITCDSDGKINSFITGENKIQKTLPLHSLNGEPYCLGLFLMGAYQDIMGDLHNLFGRVNEAHIFLDPDEPTGFYIEETIPGTTIGSVLADVQYDTVSLAREMKQLIDAAIKSDVMKPSEGMRWLESYERGLKSSTYLEFS